jgi:glycosyltransferase involved in cell wall biosynthesis
MHIVYLSPSTIPSKRANSIHVMKMCEAFSLQGCDVTLFAQGENKPYLDDYNAYGVKNNFTIIKHNLLPFGRFATIIQGFISVIKCWKLSPDLIYSRHTYSSFFASFLNIPLIHEDHQLPPPLHKYLLRRVFKANIRKVVLISESLKNDYKVEFKLKDILLFVAHDGASEISNQVHDKYRLKINISGKTNVGYIGQLYPGKGIEIIAQIANLNSNCVFHVVGGSDYYINYWKNKIQSVNVIFHGYIDHGEVAALFNDLDILLAPYQEKCFAGGKYNISKWMSPLKIFEYMAAKKPIICSDLPVLREILKDKHNALLVPASVPEYWSNALQFIINNPDDSKKLAKNAYVDYSENYSWNTRAKSIISSVKLYDK